MLQTRGKFRGWQNTPCTLSKRQASTSGHSKPSSKSWGGGWDIGKPMTGQAASVFDSEEPRKALAKCPWLKRSLPASLPSPLSGLSLGYPAGQKSIRTSCLSVSGLWWAQYRCSPFCTCKLKRNKINKKNLTCRNLDKTVVSKYREIRPPQTNPVVYLENTTDQRWFPFSLFSPHLETRAHNVMWASIGKQAFCAYDAENQENIISNGYNKKKSFSLDYTTRHEEISQKDIKYKWILNFFLIILS